MDHQSPSFCGLSAARIFTREDVARLMPPAACLHAVRAAFASAGDGKTTSAPAPMHLAVELGGIHVKGAELPAESLAAFKINSNFSGNPGVGLPTIQGVLALFDTRNGSLLALMDSMEITLRRTAAATALAAQYLAGHESATVAIIGCGAQAAAQLEALMDVLPLKRGWAIDLDPGRATALVHRLAERLDLTAAGPDMMDVATSQADVVVTCTTSRRPILHNHSVKPGAFVAAVGADAPYKNEIHPALMASARVVVDVISQARTMGDLHHAVGAGVMSVEDVHADLSQLVSGRRPGRTSPDEIALFDSTGSALQDVAAAAAIWRARDG